MAEHYIIIGAGEAGVAAAAAVRDRASDAVIRLLTEEVGLPYDRPSLSKGVIVGEPIPTFLRKETWYRDNLIELVQGHAREVDADAQILRYVRPDGAVAQLRYDKLLIASGAQARRLPFPGVEYLRSWEDALRIRGRIASSKRVAIIGGGVVGLELASSARALDREVVVLEQGDRLMARAVAPEVSTWMAALHRNAGVDLRFGVSISGLCKQDTETAIDIGWGEILRADVVIAGIGAAPRTAVGEAAGCAIEDGILVDASGRTSVSNIYAAGDAARFFHPGVGAHIRLETWQHAGRHGAHVGAAMAGSAEPYRCTPWFWTDQHEVNIQVAGFAADAKTTIWRGGGAKRTAFHFAGERLIAVTAIDNGREIRPGIQLIEAGWSGDPAILADESRPLRATLQAWSALSGDPAAVSVVA